MDTVDPSLSVAELVAIVDENDNVVGSATRREMREKTLLHRATYIFVQNCKGQLYVQKRTLTKDYCPGWFDVCSGGVLQYGETYEQNAYRELEEEMGISGIQLEHHFSFLFEKFVWGDVWFGSYDGEVTPQPEEVESVHLMSVSEIKERAANGEKFTPDGLMALDKLLQVRQIGPYSLSQR
eukprot:GILK01011019.1.p1 GENE.GILK01011019.1~~GILK01011019.1.p1  ORF type:complete len:181 (-),score=22.99 GILK01011019.1:201-743(-)